MILNTVWFILLAVLFTGFFFLEGFDYGVGILLPFLSKKDTGRRIIINTIGPVWDANEVWMITAGGAMFASFPHVYATLFSGFYLALVLLLVVLILRGLGFEFRGRMESHTWRSFWDWAIFTGSLVPAFLWGVVAGNLMRGFAIETDMNYYGGLLPLLNAYSLLTGLVFVALFTMQGANFLRLKTTGEIAGRARRSGITAWIIAAVLTSTLFLWTYYATDLLIKPGLNGFYPALLAVTSLLLAGWFAWKDKERPAFLTGTLAVIFTTIMIFAGLYPRILISSIDPNLSLTITNAASSTYTLKVMSIAAAIFLPIVLAYLAWTYRVFRKRVESKPGDLTY